MREYFRRVIRLLDKKKRAWKSITISLAAAVVFVTTYMLILPAITVERDTAHEVGLILGEPEGAAVEADAQETGADQPAPVQQETAQSEQEPEAAVEYSAGTLRASGAGYEVTVRYGKDACISPNAALQVKELTPDTVAYDIKLAKAEATVVQQTNMHVQKARLLDITILDGERVIEPSNDVDVQITLFDEDMAAKKNLEVLHDHENKNVRMVDDLTVDTTEEKAVLRFATDSFSTYIVVATEKTQTVYVGSTVYMAGNSGEGTNHRWTTSNAAVVSLTNPTDGTTMTANVNSEGTATVTHTYQRKMYTFQDKRYELVNCEEYFYLEAVPVGGPGANPAQLLDLSAYLKTGSAANEWQVVDERYSGNNPANKNVPAVYAETDTSGTTPLSGRDYGSNEPIIRLQKNVIPTGTENEFYVYLSVDKPMSLAELFSDATFAISTNASFQNNVGDVYDGLQGNPSVMEDSAAAGVAHKVIYRVWDNVDAQGNGSNNDGSRVPLSTFEANKYGSTPQASNGCLMLRVPIDDSFKRNGGDGTSHWYTGQPKFQCTGEWAEYGWLVLAGKASLKVVNSQIVVDIAKGSILSNFDTHLTSLYDDVIDKMGDNIEFLGVEKCDGGWTFKEGTLTWSPVENQAVRASEKVWPSQQNWYHNDIQMVYKIRLNVTDEKSCAETLSSPQASKAAGDFFPTNDHANITYVRANKVVKADDGSLTYDDKDAKTYWSRFRVPSVRGLLYDVRIDKFDKLEPTKPIAGTTFEIYSTQDTNAAPVGVGVTAADGRLEFTQISYNFNTNGVYWIKETIPGDGYLPTTAVFPITLSYTLDKNSLQQDAAPYADNMVGILPYDHAAKFLNVPICVEIKKIDKDTQNPLSGVAFKLTLTEKLGDKTYVPDPTKDVFTGTTDGNGIIRWERVTPGTYTLEETKAPAGYAKLVSTTITVDGLGNVTVGNGDANITVDGKDTVNGVDYAVIKAADSPIHIAIKKVDPLGNPVTTKNVSFLFDGTKDFTGTTDGEGMIYWDYVPIDAYTLKETAHPTDYKSIPDCAVTINDDGSVTIGTGSSNVSLINDITVNGKTYHVIQVVNKYAYLDVIPRKADIDGSHYLANASFEIRRNDPMTGDLIGTYTTDSAGYFVSGEPHTIRLSHVPDGIYYITETVAPVGYTLPAGPWKMVVTEDGICVYSYNPDGEDHYAVATFTGTATNNVVEFALNDSAAKTLPKTGGMGTGLYTTWGISMLIAAGAMYCFTAKRRKAGGDTAR